MEKIAQKKILAEEKLTPKEQLEKLPNEKQEFIKQELTDKQKKDLEGLITAIEAAGMEEFIEYIRSPWKMLWPNFVAGMARWVGTLLGAAIVIAIIGWVLTKMISLPLIGKSLEPYIKNVQGEITKYTESTNYNDNFEHMEKLMTEIRDELKVQNSRLGR